MIGNSNVIAVVIKRVAKGVTLNYLKQYGKFSKGSDLFFHGFDNVGYLMKALEKGKFGRTRHTSLSTPKGHGVPYYNRVWFKKPTALRIFPVFYPTREGDAKAMEIKEALAEVFGIDFLEAQVGHGQYESEQEWYYPGEVLLNKLKLIAVEYRHATEDQERRLHELCDKWNVDCYSESPF